MQHSFYSLHPVPFYQDTIYAVEKNGELYAPVRPIIENLGIDWANQFTKLRKNKDRWSVVEITTVAGDSKSRSMLCIPVRKLAGFLATIDPRKCKANVREKLLSYQRECDDALWQYWRYGRAENPRGQTADAQSAEALAAAPFEIPETLPDALRMAAELADKIEQDKPKVEFAEAVANVDNTLSIGEFSNAMAKKGVEIGQNRLFAWLRRSQYLKPDNLPYQRYIDAGWFQVVEKLRPDENRTSYLQTRITGRGQTRLAKKIREALALIEEATV